MELHKTVEVDGFFLFVYEFLRHPAAVDRIFSPLREIACAVHVPEYAVDCIRNQPVPVAGDEVRIFVQCLCLAESLGKSLSEKPLLFPDDPFIVHFGQGVQLLLHLPVFIVRRDSGCRKVYIDGVKCKGGVGIVGV